MNNRNPQSGFTMVEVMVALIVLTIGLLGIAALYLDSLQAGRTAIYRTQAVTLAADLADRIRMNRTALAAYGAQFTDTGTETAACQTTGGCTDAELASDDVFHWKEQLAQVLPGGEGQVAVTLPPATGEPASYVITVQWSEVGEAAKVSFQLGFQT